MTKFIAELCQNHNGDIEILKEMVDIAAESGASHIKIQHILSKNLVYRPIFETGYSFEGQIHSVKRPWKSEFDRLLSLELSLATCDKFVDHVLSYGLVPLTTCFARCDIEEISDRGFKQIKVASYDLASYQLLRELSHRFDHIFVSTGASYDSEIKLASKILSEGESTFSMLHCVTIYPTSLLDVNLARINWLKQYSCEVGFSDHTLVNTDDVWASKVAIYLGASFVERHFTILESSETRDGLVSVKDKHVKDILSFAALSRSDQLLALEEHCKDWEVMIGKETRNLTHEELLNRDYYRGRFASPILFGIHDQSQMIYNWEETPL